MSEDNFTLYDGLTVAAFCPVIGIGMWKEYITYKGDQYEIKKYLFPFFIVMKFYKFEKNEE